MSVKYSSETELNSPKLSEFWAVVTQATLTVNSQIKLAYAYIEHPQSQQAIVISSGRVESYIKYAELMYDMYQQGYSVYCVDHRGQGLSSRMTPNSHQGHVDQFEDYVDDFEAFIDNVVQKQSHQNLFLVAHSMGSTIASLYMLKHPQTFTAAVMCAPMFGISLPVPSPFILTLARLLNRYQPGKAANYILGGSDYDPTPFIKNDLTHSQSRYQYYRQLYETHPQAQLGSPTNQWLIQSLLTCNKLANHLKELQTPTLILQAELDTVVDNCAHKHASNTSTQLYQVKGAKHEIFMETDPVRSTALEQLFNFLQHAVD